MRRWCLLLFFLFLWLSGCAPQANKEGTVTADLASLKVLSSDSAMTPAPVPTSTPYADLYIKKGKLGGIRIGMTIKQAEEVVSCRHTLIRKVDEAVNFGFGGGSPAYLYYAGDTLIFGLIPKLDTDTLLFIIAAYKGLFTPNGLHPGSTVGAIVAAYPGIRVKQDLMNEWEVIQEDENKWDFVFMTDEKTAIGIYPEAVSKPLRTSAQTDWILIR